MKKLAYILALLSGTAYGQGVTYSYATPFAITKFANNVYTVNTTTSVNPPFVDYALPMFPVCFNSTTGKYYGCSFGASVPSTSNVLKGDGTGNAVAATPGVDYATPPTSNPVTTATGATGTGAITCLIANCTNLRGSYSIVGGTATTGNVLTLVWPTTTTPYVCMVSQNGGTAFLGLGHSVATATGMTVSAGVSVVGTTFTFDYQCNP